MIIVANWKAKVSDLKKAKNLISVSKRIAQTKGNRVIVAPPAPFLGILAQTKSKIAFSGQDISETDGGAQTGEVTGAMLKASGARYVIIGHSERRALGETDAVVARKVQKAHAVGLTPIVCIGEKQRDAEAQYLHKVRSQLEAVYSATNKKGAENIILAYEPVWAIGKSAKDAITPDDLIEMVRYIRKVVGQCASKKIAETTDILYGGAVEDANARSLTKSTGVSGVLVGHASTEPKSFAALAKALS